VPWKATARKVLALVSCAFCIRLGFWSLQCYYNAYISDGDLRLYPQLIANFSILPVINAENKVVKKYKKMMT